MAPVIAGSCTGRWSECAEWGSRVRGPSLTSEFTRPAGRGVQGSGYSAVQDFDMEGECV